EPALRLQHEKGAMRRSRSFVRSTPRNCAASRSSCGAPTSASSENGLSSANSVYWLRYRWERQSWVRYLAASASQARSDVPAPRHAVRDGSVASKRMSSEPRPRDRPSSNFGSRSRTSWRRRSPSYIESSKVRSLWKQCESHRARVRFMSSSAWFGLLGSNVRGGIREDELDATVLLPPGRVLVACDGKRFALTDRHDLRALHAAFEQRHLDRLRSPLGELLVVFLCARAVSVSLDRHPSVGILFQHLRHTLDGLIGSRLQRCLAHVEQDVSQRQHHASLRGFRLELGQLLLEAARTFLFHLGLPGSLSRLALAHLE